MLPLFCDESTFLVNRSLYLDLPRGEYIFLVRMFCDKKIPFNFSSFYVQTISPLLLHIIIVIWALRPIYCPNKQSLDKFHNAGVIFETKKSVILCLYMITFCTWVYGQNIMFSMSKPITNLNIAFISNISQRNGVIWKCKTPQDKYQWKYVASPPAAHAQRIKHLQTWQEQTTKVILPRWKGDFHRFHLFIYYIPLYTPNYVNPSVFEDISRLWNILHWSLYYDLPTETSILLYCIVFYWQISDNKKETGNKKSVNKDYILNTSPPSSSLFVLFSSDDKYKGQSLLLWYMYNPGKGNCSQINQKCLIVYVLMSPYYHIYVIDICIAFSLCDPYNVSTKLIEISQQMKKKEWLWDNHDNSAP